MRLDKIRFSSYKKVLEILDLTYSHGAEELSSNIGYLLRENYIVHINCFSSPSLVKELKSDCER